VNATSSNTTHQTTVPEPPTRPELAVPNYALYGSENIRDVTATVTNGAVQYLRGLDFRTLALVLWLLGLTAVGVTLGWPASDQAASRPTAAWGVAALLTLSGLAAILIDKGDSRAKAAEERADQPADAGPGGAGPEAAGSVEGPYPGG